MARQTQLDVRAVAEQVKRVHSIEEVVARYGIELRGRGRSLTGRCPFHNDGGNPNFSIRPERHTYRCWRCGEHGDTIDFVMKIERCSFKEAVQRITGDRFGEACLVPLPPPPKPKPARREPHPLDYRALEIAVDTYSTRLTHTPEALGYLAARGIDRIAASRLKLGYAEGSDLEFEFGWRDIPAGSAELLGILKRMRGGRYCEHFQGRIVIPDFRGGKAHWAMARAFNVDDWRARPAWRHGENIWQPIEGERQPPKYLCMPGEKPLMGLDAVRDAPEIYLVEGPFDFLTLSAWGYPTVALLGTDVRAASREQLARFGRVNLVLDNDSAGRESVPRLREAIGEWRARPIFLPIGIKDVGELDALPDGAALFAERA